ncbi:MAG TPA: phosphoethanolamine--lipid A transferase [Albitalea sp.]|nr:phosphoethanolamine--lipid A transferase [Albitalea sp.]
MPARPTSNRLALNPLSVAVLVASWIALFANWPLWRALAVLPEMASLRGALFIAGFGVMVAAVTTALLALFAWRWTLKPVAALLLIAAAFGAHFMGTYGVVIDPTMMVNVLQTNVGETRDLLSLRLLVSVLLLAGLPLLWLWRVPLHSKRFLPQLGRNAAAIVAALVLAALVLVASFAELASTMRNHKALRYLINPLNSVWALAVVGLEGGARPKGPPQPIGLDARVLPRPGGTKPPLLMFVIGETARADHFALNGYARPTNPELATLPVLSFGNVSACGTNTAASLPCMFSHRGKKGFDARKHDDENLLDLLQRAGLAVLWIDNQAGCKGVCERVPQTMADNPPPADKRLCSDGECLDEVMLQGLDRRLDALPQARRGQGVVLVLHQMGSHGPAYYKRSPPTRKPFQPECTTNVLQQCERQALINAYDNSIAYTDHVLAQSIGWLTQQADRYDTALLYVSDHGESLGENNLYLHGLPYALAPREQTHVPMLLWLAPGAARSLQPACLQAQRSAAWSHDNLFHSVLGLIGVTASEYQPALDVLAACRAH